MKSYFSLVKFSHTVFALPFAMVGFFLALHRSNTELSVENWWILLLKVIGCMVFARSAAMAFNRYLDRDIDAKNPRTLTREIPAGVISSRAAWIFVAANCLLFTACAWSINSLCFYLSPVALAVILGYSYTKRFTALCHLVLGTGLALAPVGAWLAVTGRFDWIPVTYGFMVLAWVSGFDIIYALQDAEFDKAHQLHSIPSALGRGRALRMAAMLHVLAAALLLWNAYQVYGSYAAMFWLFGAANFVFLGMLWYQHSQVSEHDLSRVNLAFFTTNGIASVLFGTLTIADLYL